MYVANKLYRKNKMVTNNKNVTAKCSIILHT